MRNIIILTIILVTFYSCKSSKTASKPLVDEYTYQISSISDDKTYGYSEKNPVKVGGAMNGGPLNERRYLNGLSGPNGEELSYERKGSCCPFKTPNGILDKTGLLDIYHVSYTGSDKNFVIYINMYDSGELKAPVGFSFTVD